jgi:DNA-binding GntR family transcriptional regulator
VYSVIESKAAAKQEITVSTPSYQVVIDHITAGIKAGLYPLGQQLPTIAKLAELTGQSETAVKTALLLLGRAGVTYGRQGKGSYVSDPQPSEVAEP